MQQKAIAQWHTWQYGLWDQASHYSHHNSQVWAGIYSTSCMVSAIHLAVANHFSGTTRLALRSSNLFFKHWSIFSWKGRSWKVYGVLLKVPKHLKLTWAQSHKFSLRIWKDLFTHGCGSSLTYLTLLRHLLLVCKATHSFQLDISMQAWMCFPF